MMAAMCLHFEQAKDSSFDQYINTFIEINVLPVIGEQVTVNGCKHLVTQVLLDDANLCAQVYLAEIETEMLADQIFNTVHKSLKQNTANQASLIPISANMLH